MASLARPSYLHRHVRLDRAVSSAAQLRLLVAHHHVGEQVVEQPRARARQWARERRREKLRSGVRGAVGVSRGRGVLETTQVGDTVREMAREVQRWKSCES